MNSLDRAQLSEKIKQAKLRLLRMHFDARVGHIGGNLSCLDLLMTLHHLVMKEKDEFILSKGHSAGALYVTLWSRGLLSESDLKTFHQDDTLCSAHPPAHGIEGIRFATGSLGHGFSLAAGIALAKQFQNDAGRVFCLTSDGEWNEGATWEATIFAVHQRLHNLTVIIDVNGLQGFGTTKEVANLEPLLEKFQAFGCEVIKIDGHDPSQIASALDTIPGDKVRVVLANTVKGNGVSFMQNKLEWHYWPMSEQQFAVALSEVEKS